jgi:hypothetical protein
MKLDQNNSLKIIKQKIQTIIFQKVKWSTFITLSDPDGLA